MFDASLSTKAVPGRRETVALLAGLMALNAFAIDAMIPALPAIGDTLGIALDNDRQLVVIAYMLGFGVGQLFWGPLADRFGRKPVLAVGVALYAGFALGCALASSFFMLIAFRVAMGVAAAVTRVLVTAMVRDLFDGPAMAQVMSLIFMVFMVIPVIAPSLGQAILFFGEWHLIFLVLAGYATIMWLWGMIRLPETLHSEFRRPLNPGAIANAARQVVTDRLSLGYTLAATAIFGGLTAYIASIQQIVFDVFKAPDAIGIVFASVAAPMSVAAYTNSRVVTRFGLRHVGHLGMIGFLASALLHLAIAWRGESLWSFVALQALLMVSFAFCSANLSTIAMTNMAPIAGTASSVQGVTASVGGAAIGFVIGRQFDGTTLPFLIGLVACGATALLIVLITERGHLVRERRIATAPLPECNP
jgi:DHA1 family bicyclomycin/chloramphenicol resistance-like MFS transporter